MLPYNFILISLTVLFCNSIVAQNKKLKLDTSFLLGAFPTNLNSSDELHLKNYKPKYATFVQSDLNVIDKLIKKKRSSWYVPKIRVLVGLVFFNELNDKNFRIDLESGTAWRHIIKKTHVLKYAFLIGASINKFHIEETNKTISGLSFNYALMFDYIYLMKYINITSQLQWRRLQGEKSSYLSEIMLNLGVNKNFDL